jgi:WD40-like Beta Propeller Repeat
VKLHDLLRELPIPEQEEARRRSHAVVRAAFAEREPTPQRRHYVKPALALAALAAVVAAAASPPGRAVLGSLRKTVAGQKRAAPELFALPSGGRLLVNSPHGPWIVQPNGSRRRLGAYRAAAWSPHGKYVVVTRADEVVAVTPKGDVHWTVPRPRVSFARWGGSRIDTRVAYLSGSRLHMVAGDGTGDVDLCGEPAAAPVAPEWRPPGLPHVLAFADVRGRVSVLDADRCSGWRSAPFPHPRALRWSNDGRRLLLVTRDKLVMFDERRARPLGVRFLRGVTDAAFRPGSHEVALVRGGEVLALDADRLGATPHRLFRVTGRIGQIAWSPNGRWLLVTWPDADQFLFVHGRRIRAFSGIARQFGGGAFPSIGGWCCSSS